MKRSVWLPLVILAIVTAVFGIITALNQSGAPALKVDGDWFLSEGTDAEGDLDLTGDAIRLTIADGQVSGQICNSWGGSIDINGSSVTFGALVSTEMYCTEPAGIMDRETRFLADLPLVTSIELVDGTLHLTGGDVDLTFVGGY